MAARLRAAAVLPALVAALALHWPASAQDADAPPLRIPDLTVTAEDPLILLPPLGPPVNQTPLAVPPADRQPVAYRDAPAVTAAGFGPAPPPAGVLRVARSVPAVQRSAQFAAAVAAVGTDTLHGIPAAVRYRNGGMEPTVALGLSGLVPVIESAAGDVSAHAALEFPSWRGGLDGAATFAGHDRAGQVELSGAAGPVSGALSIQHWQAQPADPEWRLALAAEVASMTPPSGPQAALGLAAGWAGEDLFALPAVRVRYAGKPDWHLAAGVRPMLGYPRWLHHLIREQAGGTAGLRPEQGWLAWLGGGFGAVDLRAGWAHGLTPGAGAGAGERARRAAGPGVLLVGMAAETAWQTGGGPVMVAARAGANWDRHDVRWRLHAAGEWQFATVPPITLLLGARWIGFREYYAVFPDEDWTLAIFRDAPESAVIAGVRWSPAWGHRLELVGGINFLPAGDLRWGIGIEYARDIVRLTAPP